METFTFILKGCDSIEIKVRASSLVEAKKRLRQIIPLAYDSFQYVVSNKRAKAAANE